MNFDILSIATDAHAQERKLNTTFWKQRKACHLCRLACHSRFAVQPLKSALSRIVNRVKIAFVGWVCWRDLQARFSGESLVWPVPEMASWRKGQKLLQRQRKRLALHCLRAIITSSTFPRVVLLQCRLDLGKICCCFTAHRFDSTWHHLRIHRWPWPVTYLMRWPASIKLSSLSPSLVIMADSPIDDKSWNHGLCFIYAGNLLLFRRSRLLIIPWV